MEVSYKWERFLKKVVESTDWKHMKIFRTTLNEMEVSVIKTLKREKKNYLGQPNMIPFLKEISERKTAFPFKRGKIQVFARSFNNCFAMNIFIYRQF